MQSTNKRLDNLDLIKAIGIVMVLSLHVPLWKYDFITIPKWTHVLQYIGRLSAEGVPIFVFVNGFLLLGKKTFDLKKHLRKMGHLFFLFILWSIILITVGQLSTGQSKEAFSLNAYFLYILNTKVGSPYTGVLWFLQNLLGVYLIFPAIKRVYDTDWRIYSYIFAVVAFFSVGKTVITLVLGLLQRFAHMPNVEEIVFFIGRFNSIANGDYVYYFMLGGIVAKYSQEIKQKRVVLSMIGLLSWIVSIVFAYKMSIIDQVVYNPAFNYNSVFMTFILIGLFSFTLPYMNQGKPHQKLLSSLGSNTMGMYLTHYIFIYIVNRYLPGVNGSIRFLRFLIVLICSYLLTLVMGKLPILKRIL